MKRGCVCVYQQCNNLPFSIKHNLIIFCNYIETCKKKRVCCIKEDGIGLGNQGNISPNNSFPIIKTCWMINISNYGKCYCASCLWWIFYHYLSRCSNTQKSLILQWLISILDRSFFSFEVTIWYLPPGRIA